MANLVVLSILLTMSTLPLLRVDAALSQDQKTFLLQRHNELRGKVSPTAADMRALVWDDRLERVASQYAARCIWEHNSKASEDYHSVGGDKIYVGENLYASVGYDKNTALSKAMTNFFEERRYYSFQNNHCSKEPCGHYTQMVWATSKAVGCALRRCNRMHGISGQGWDRPAYYLVCNYGPTGNWVGQRPYQAGRPCSKCPSDASLCVNNLCFPTSGASQSARSEPDKDSNTDRAPARSEPDKDSNSDRAPAPVVQTADGMEKRVAALESSLRETQSRLTQVLDQRRSLSSPSAHLDGQLSQTITVASGSELKYWSTSGRRAHLSGGFKFSNGRLVVPQTGHYFVYSQVWHVGDSDVRHFIYADPDRRLAVGGASRAKGQTTWAGGVFHFQAGESLFVRVGTPGSSKTYTIWPGGAHTYFGAFMVSV